MAKELPYFKFEPAEYLTKNISFCSLSAQGLFANICCYYWQRSCTITREQILRRLNYPNELNELINEGILDLDGENITIKFLNKQMKSAIEKSNKNSNNGKKGGRPRTLNLNQNETEEKPNALFSLSESKGIRKDKIKEDKIKEEESKVNNSPYGDGELHFLCREYAAKNQDKYKAEVYTNFLEYWTAIVTNGKGKGKELWRTEKTFSLSGRLATSYKIIWQDKEPPKTTFQKPLEQRNLIPYHTPGEKLI